VLNDYSIDRLTVMGVSSVVAGQDSTSGLPTCKDSQFETDIEPPKIADHWNLDSIVPQGSNSDPILFSMICM
jgi:hypothetical protein